MVLYPKPNELPFWATSNYVDPITGQPNVVTPPLEKQTNGWLREFPPRQWFNWLGRFTGNWIAYLSQQEAQSVVTDGTGLTPSFDVNNIPTGAIAIIYVVDKGNAANVYNGMVYLPSAPGVPTAFVDIKKVGITTPSIAVDGSVTIAGGTGPYISYCQTKIA